MKKISFKKYHFFALVAVLIATLGLFNRCEDDLEGKTFLTEEGVLMGEYMEFQPDTFAEFYKILEVTNSVSFLNAYGTYTLFAPSNEAVKAFYAKLGKSGIEDFTTEEDLTLLRQIIAYHLLPDTLYSTSFTNGGLPDTTMSGDFLVTSFEGNGINIVVNNKANIIKRDIATVNGIIHVIDQVLDPVIYTVAQLLEQNAEYSIFSEALKQTGLYDSLNIKSFKVTVFAESDSVFAHQGINSYEDLYARFSNTGEPYLNVKDSLYLWIAYHCMTSTLFLPDFQNITYSNFTHTILLSVNKSNEFLLNKTPTNVNKSNNTAKNGVFHSLEGLIDFVPTPVAVYWEIVDKPEIRALPDFYRKASIPLIPGPELPDGVNGIRVAPGDTWKCGYQSGHTFRDYFEYKFDAANNRLWFEFDTPPLVKGGTYKIWICGKSVTGNRGTGDVYWDGEYAARLPMGNQFSGTDEELEEIGRKLYTEGRSSQFVGYLIGTFTIETDGSHTIKVVAVEDGHITLDMIHFIPVDEDQTAVKFPNG